MEFLLPELMELLWELEGDVAGNTLAVLMHVLEQMDINVASPIALQLAERLPTFFENVRLRAQGPAGVSPAGVSVGRCLSQWMLGAVRKPCAL